VGKHRVIIEKYLSEGGFAHVYVVRLPKPVDGSDLAVLKRVAVPDKEHLGNMRTEVETMKKLKGHRQIVRYIDSHASQLKGGGYEVFLLMEYCSGGGLIDFMNTRLRNRLTEPEILKIFSDVAEGVACMHYLRPPLLHRDLKIENVLISNSGPSTTYKLCDFGSAASARPAAATAAEGRLIEDDIQRHTTLQYRSPEMIDVYRKQAIDEKSDVWALGVFLYKLCYYTTPFEEAGQMAILNASFKYPAHPAFSDNLKMLIASMLRENPAKRPNIYQLLQQACSMQGKEVPIRDIYPSRSHSESRQSSQRAAPAANMSPAAGAMLSPPSPAKSAAIPDIAPMRRGRPTKAVSHHGSAQPSPSPLRMVNEVDPFASLDGNKLSAADELSSRFPTLDQFSLVTEKGMKFEFESAASREPEVEKSDLSQRVLNALADDAFARPPSPVASKPTKMTPPMTNPSSRVLLDRNNSYETKGMRGQAEKSESAAPHRPAMVSTGTMTCPSPPLFSVSNKAIHRFPPPANHDRRHSSLPRSTEASRSMSAVAGSGSRLSTLLSQDAARSQPAALPEPKSPSSSRPSLESSRPSMMELDGSISRSKSANSKMRPASMNLVSQMDFYHGRTSNKPTVESVERGRDEDLVALTSVESDTNIASDVEYLRAKEEEEKVWKGHKRHSSGSGHKKRGSLPSISLSGTKNLLAGRFGDAFRKFEAGNSGSNVRSRSPSPSQDVVHVLTPISGSVATDLSDERHGVAEAEELSPEMRRELERRRLSAEEKRVANAAAEYRKKLAEKGGERGRDPTRAASIQNKVQSLLQENDRPATRSAAGYGRFTNSDTSPQVRQFEAQAETPMQQSSRIHGMQSQITTSPVLGDKSLADPSATVISRSSFPSIAASKAVPQRATAKPAAPPKPKSMRTGMGEPIAQAVGSSLVHSNAPDDETDDWETSFTQRYPSLTGLEMVETEIDAPKATVRTKEV
jgi:AP2-associated kinase